MLCMVTTSMQGVLDLLCLMVLAAFAFTAPFFLAFAQWGDPFVPTAAADYGDVCEAQSAADMCGVTGDGFGDWGKTYMSVLSMAVGACSDWPCLISHCAGCNHRLLLCNSSTWPRDFVIYVQAGGAVIMCRLQQCKLRCVHSVLL